MPTLDLSKPGKLWATAENEDQTTFHLVIPKAEYTKDRLTANPTINPQDELMKPFSVAESKCDGQGRALLDLGATGRANEILAKLDQLYDAGHAPIRQVRGVVVVTAKQGNRIPAKQLADILDFDLAPTPHIGLRGIKTYITVQNFIGGDKDFVVEVTAIGPLNQLQLSTSPSRPLRVDGGPSGASVTVPVRDGQKLMVRIEAPFTVKKGQTKRVAVPRTYRHFVPGGWRRGEVDYRTDTLEEWTGSDVTLRAAGTGAHAGISKTIKLRAEAWGSRWLQGPPPPPFAHNIC